MCNGGRVWLATLHHIAFVLGKIVWETFVFFYYRIQSLPLASFLPVAMKMKEIYVRVFRVFFLNVARHFLAYVVLIGRVKPGGVLRHASQNVYWIETSGVRCIAIFVLWG